MSRLMIALVSINLFDIACNNQASPGETSDRTNGFTPALKTQEDSLFHDVMQGHDAGMAKVGKLRKNINATQHLLDSLGKVPAQKVNAAYKQSLTDLHTALNNANNEMTSWMDGFKLDSASDNKELRIKYLQEEKVKVTMVKELIFSALNRADSLLKPIGNKQ
jgi:phage-related minor tail protein